MARVGPDTSNPLKIWVYFEHFGGYFYNDTHINTFSHLHMVGSGAVDYGWIGLFPVAVKKNQNLNDVLTKKLG